MIHRLVHALSPIPGVSPSARSRWLPVCGAGLYCCRERRAGLCASSPPLRPLTPLSRESSEAASRLQVNRSFYASHIVTDLTTFGQFSKFSKIVTMCAFQPGLTLCLSLSRAERLWRFKVCTRCSTAQVSRWYYGSHCHSFTNKLTNVQLWEWFWSNTRLKRTRVKFNPK